MKNKLTTEVIVLRKKLTVIPLVAVPLLAFFFNQFGGGKGYAKEGDSLGKGFNIDVPKSDAENMVNSKNSAYSEEGNNQYMKGFNSDLPPEIDLDSNSEVDQMVEVTNNDFDAQKDLLSLYEKHNSSLENDRREAYEEYKVKKETKTIVANNSNKPEINKSTRSTRTITESIDEDLKPQVNKSLFNDSRKSNTINSSTNNNEILAVIHGDQEIGGSRNKVKLRTKKSTTINGVHIPSNTIIYATASINNNRLNLTVHNIAINNRTQGLPLKVYDASDGNLGLNISSESIISDEKDKLQGDIVRSSTNAVGGTGILGAVIVGTGNAIGNIFSKNSNNSSILLISNHQIILK